MGTQKVDKTNQLACSTVTVQKDPEENARARGCHTTVACRGVTSRMQPKSGHVAIMKHSIKQSMQSSIKMNNQQLDDKRCVRA